ncbi:MAG: hypothetical protein V9E86_09720 [Nitrosomonas sp.]
MRRRSPTVQLWVMLFVDLAQRFPALGEACMHGRFLKTGFIANLRGERFVSDPSTRLQEGDNILLLSVDAGG